ncbi:glucan endo-1,3-beta-glucosidase A1-like [Paramacrobiotus metropolitanus]|uniref:glucan endo-1,3-beta-glucosidase A1-like n=1 Tax=Paramacrobiotus metropolitanus TaxID=2943436 RepID=UPI00244656FF|nr:glucan endo-1,3-beta-glucosidase A1-like [Paramacrobiotus metropolitanus]
MKAIAIIALCMALGHFHGAECLQYVQVFRDDFTPNHAIDGSKWNVITKPSTVNEELQHYVYDDVWQEHGFIFLRGQRRSWGGRQYTSGRVDTQNKFQFLYGEVEWRAKLPLGKGMWPALWLLHFQCPPASPCPGTWPPEIDVMEFRGDIPNKVTTTVHFGRYPNNGHDGRDFWGPDFTADFHNYKVIWDPNQIVWFVDGQEVFKVTDANKIPHEPMYLIMNLAVGGWFGGNPDGSTPFPAHFIIDWVTVHRWQ